MPRRWKWLKHYHCRAIVFSAIRSMRRTHGGAWTYSESCEIAEDLVDDGVVVHTNKYRNDFAGVHEWTKEQCWIFLIRGILRGVFVDNGARL